MIAFRGGCSRAEVGEKAFGRVAFAIVAVKGFGGERKYLFQLWMHHCADKRLMRGGLTPVLMVLDTTVVTVNGVRGKGTGAIKGNGEMTVKNSIRLKHLTPLQLCKDIRQAAAQVSRVHLIQALAHRDIRWGVVYSMRAFGGWRHGLCLPDCA